MKRVSFKKMGFHLDSLQGLYPEVFAFLAALESDKFHKFRGLSGRGVYWMDQPSCLPQKEV